MIVTLAFTILIEATLVIAYSFWNRKPFFPILSVSIVANLITQSLLWAAVLIFYENYRLVLGIMEILVWFLECQFFYRIRAVGLKFSEATFLSLVINLFSFGVGWFLPGSFL